MTYRQQPAVIPFVPASTFIVDYRGSNGVFLVVTVENVLLEAGFDIISASSQVAILASDGDTKYGKTLEHLLLPYKQSSVVFRFAEEMA